MKRREAAIGLLLAAPAVMGLLAFLVLPFGYTFLRLLYRWLGLGAVCGGWRTMQTRDLVCCSCWR